MHVPYCGVHHAIDDPSTLLVTLSPASGSSSKYQYFDCPSFPVGLLSCYRSLEPPHVLPSSSNY